jgi:glucokinase
LFIRYFILVFVNFSIKIMCISGVRGDFVYLKIYFNSVPRYLRFSSFVNSGYAQVHSKVGNLARQAPQIRGSEAMQAVSKMRMPERVGRGRVDRDENLHYLVGMRVLAGDIGGTKTRLALYEGNRCMREERFSSREFASLTALLKQFSPQGVGRACFGVAGPVRQGRCQATNLPWVVDAQELAKETGIPSVRLLNDLEANAYGLACLGEEEFVTLQEGIPGAVGNQALISAGTGLGEAGLVWDGRTHRPFPSEGGHVDFAPRDALEVELWEYLRALFQHASYERVLSGPGLYHLYRFLVETGKEREEAPLPEGDRPKMITERALAGACPLCLRCVRWFISLYGSEAGNLALKYLSLGGVFIGGGIAPKIAGLMQDKGFMEAFLDKGRLRGVLEGMAVKIVVNDRTALLGAARCAREEA